MKWFRMYHEARTDEKLKSLTDAEFRVWFRLMCYANEQQPRGVIQTRTKRLMAVEVAQGDVGLYERTIEILQELEIVIVTDSSIQITHWDKRQYASDESTKRWQKWNEKQKSNVGQTLDKQESNVGQTDTQQQLTPPDTDTDTDTESDPETAKRKNTGGDEWAVAKELHACYEQTFGRPPNPTQLDELVQYTQLGMEIDLVKRALTRTRLHGSSLTYALGILENQIVRGIKTIAQAELDDAKHQTAAGGERSGGHQRNSTKAAVPINEYRKDKPGIF